MCTEKPFAAHIYRRLATSAAGYSAATAGHNVHAGSVHFPGSDCERSEIERDAESGVRIFGNLLSDSVLHLLTFDG